MANGGFRGGVDVQVGQSRCCLLKAGEGGQGERGSASISQDTHTLIMEYFWNTWGAEGEDKAYDYT